MLEFVQLEKLGSPVLNNNHFSDQQDSPRLQAYRGGALRGADGDAASILSMSLNEGDAQVSSAETREAGGRRRRAGLGRRVDSSETALGGRPGPVRGSDTEHVGNHHQPVPVFPENTRRRGWRPRRSPRDSSQVTVLTSPPEFATKYLPFVISASL